MFHVFQFLQSILFHRSLQHQSLCSKPEKRPAHDQYLEFKCMFVYASGTIKSLLIAKNNILEPNEELFFKSKKSHYVFTDGSKLCFLKPFLTEAHTKTLKSNPSKYISLKYALIFFT